MLSSEARILRSEKIMTNCSPLQADRDAIAMVRAKMTRLPDEMEAMVFRSFLEG